MEPKKLQLKLLACNAAKSFSDSDQAVNWLHFNFVISYFNSVTLVSKTGLKPAAGMERQNICRFPLCPLCECLPLAGISSTPAPNSTSSIVIYIYNAYILKQRSIGATSEMHLSPAKAGAKYVPGPTEPPRLPIFQQMSMLLV